MKSTLTQRRSSSRTSVSLAPDLLWHHLGQGHRVTLWPEVAFEKEISPGLWRPYTPDPLSDVFSSGAVMLQRRRWVPYLEFCPEEWQQVIGRFAFHRLHALVALALVPSLVDDYQERPVLALLVAAHSELRGGGLPQWGELHAVAERGGVFAVLEWLGLPSTARCLEQLGEMEPDLPMRELGRVRDLLWQRHDAALRGTPEPKRRHALAA